MNRCTEGRRLDFVDATRGLAIMLVVLGHAIQFTNADFDANLAFRLIYAVHMPLFMFLSGYVTRPPRGLETLHDGRFWRKLRNLLVPYVVWLPVCYAAAVSLQQPPGFDGSLLAFLTQIPRSPDLGLWFLPVLAECHLLLLVASLGGERRASALAVALLLLVNVFVLSVPGGNWGGLGLLRWYFLFFLAGHLLRGRGGFPLHAMPSIIALLVFCALAAFWYRKSAVPVDWILGTRGGVLRQIVTQGYHAVTAFVGIFATLGLFAAACRAGHGPLQRGLAYMGGNSVQIYAGHYAFLYLAIRATAGQAGLAEVRVPMVIVFALVASLLLARVVSRSPWLGSLIYGRGPVPTNW